MQSKMRLDRVLVLAVPVAVAAAVVAARKARRAQRAPSGDRQDESTTPLAQAVGYLSEQVDHAIGWDRLPKPLGLVTLYGLRMVLRRKNLHDTSKLPAVNTPPVPPPSPEHLVSRVPSGAWNSLDDPAMGMAGSRFGRNIPVDRIVVENDSAVVSSPSPREVSRVLMTRTQLNPATSVNSLVTAWLQFMIRDWFSHGTSPTENPWVVPLQADDDWPENPMRIMRTPSDPTRPSPAPADMPPTYINVMSHWWDGSQIYGVGTIGQKHIRSGVGGKLNVHESGLLPWSADPNRDPTRVPGFWLGLLMMQTIFTKEHNSICDRLKAEYPHWHDEELFQRARLINAALMAKIHTVEWTPAVISHPTTKTALRANWYGLAEERIRRQFGRLSDSEAISGIPGSETNYHGVSYSLTEEFVAVYRMHPLVRDDWPIRALSDDSLLADYTFRDLAGPNAVEIANRIPMTDLIYSFGTLHPGLVTLHNYPRFLQEFQRSDGHLQDLAATDILRSRELGVPRYNELRRFLRLAPAKDFDDLTDNAAWANEIRRVYAGDIEKVDLVVGMYAERLPKGFAFSDTAFRIFILMASRRLNCDRFLTTHYTPAVYTPAGMDWIDANSMSTILLRHYPELRTPLASVDNAFVPWPTTGR